jgi:hypothetical protein
MLMDSASRKLTPRPIPPGWALDAVLRLDEAHAGFLRFLHTASTLRRQGVYLALTRLDWDRADEFASWLRRSRPQSDNTHSSSLAVIASGLMRFRVRDIVTSVFGATPPGLLGSLAKCGDNPLDEFHYMLLHAMHDDPKNRARANLLRHAIEIDDDAIEVVWRLPPPLLRPEVLAQINRPEHIEQYAPALHLIRRLHPAITDEDLAVSFSQMPLGSGLANWVMRWLERAECLAPSLPYAGDEMLRPIVSAADMREVARRYHNCLRSRIGAVALGRVVYYEHVGTPGAVVEVAALSDGHWVLEGVYGPKNNRPAVNIVSSVRKTLENEGVLLAAADEQPPHVQSVAEMLHIFEFSGGDWLTEPVGAAA